MAITYLDKTPRDIRYFDEELGEISEADEKEITDSFAEVFHTPLTGSYNWDYNLQDDRIKKLYELGKKLNWNSEIDVDWTQPWPEPTKESEELDKVLNPFAGWEPYERMSEADQQRVNHHMNAWGINQFLHGEQGALLVASQLISCAPTYNAKLYAASQAFDEARHVEVFNRYCQERLKLMYPINNALKDILDKILTDPRWDLKFIGMQVIIEGLALAAFNTAKMQSNVPVHKKGLHFVIRDEARHVTFGINYLEEFVKTLTRQEREERALFAFQAATGMGGSRGNQTRFYERYGWDKEALKTHLSSGSTSGQMDRASKEFRTQLFGRIMPNLKRIGLLTDNVIPMWDALGVLELQDLPSDGAINWDEMSKPLVYEEVSDSVVNA